MSETLKPCPFCGGSNILTMPPTCKRDSPYHAADRAMPVARCMSCYAEALGQNWDATCDSAISAWNTRTPDADAERLRAALRKLANEVAGAWRIAELDIRCAIGNTNYQCVKLRLDEACATLGEARND